MSSDERFFLLFVVVVVTRVVKRCKHFQLIYSPDHARMCTHHMVGVFFPRFPQLHYFSCFIRDFCLVVLINRPDAVDFGRFFFFQVLPSNADLLLILSTCCSPPFRRYEPYRTKRGEFFCTGRVENTFADSTSLSVLLFSFSLSNVLLALLYQIQDSLLTFCCRSCCRFFNPPFHSIASSARLECHIR